MNCQNDRLNNRALSDSPAPRWGALEIPIPKGDNTGKMLNNRGQTMIMGLIILIIGVALFVVGGMKVNDGCWSSGLYWMAAGCFVLGVGGTLEFHTAFMVIAGSVPAGVLALAGFVGSFAGAC